MKCDETAEAMSALLDGAPCADLEYHLASCPGCRQELEALRHANEALRGHPTLPWRPELTDRILSRAARPRFRWVSAAAAAVLIGMVAFLARPKPSAPPPELEEHIVKVKLLTNQPKDAPLNPEVLRAETEQLGLAVLQEKLRGSQTSESVKIYLEKAGVFLANADTSSLYELSYVARSLETQFHYTPVSVTISGTASMNDISLFATGQLQYANGETAAATTTFNTLVDTSPRSPYANYVYRTLGRHYQAKGDALAALEMYCSITEPSEDLVKEIKGVDCKAGIVCVDGDPISTLDTAEVRRRVAANALLTLVRETSEKQKEVSLLGAQNVARLQPLVSSHLNALKRNGRRSAVLNTEELTEKDVRQYFMKLSEK